MIPFGLNPFTAAMLMVLAAAFYEGERDVLPIGPAVFLAAFGVLLVVLIIGALMEDN